MTLFEECREALRADFNMLEGNAQQESIDILNKYPMTKGSVTWSAIKHSDYESINALLSAYHIENDHTTFIPH